MKFWGYLPLLLLLTACETPAVTDRNPEAFCELEVENNPVVEDLRIRQSNSTRYWGDVDDEIKLKRGQIKRDCLHRLGALQSSLGGVEAVPMQGGATSQPDECGTVRGSSRCHSRRDRVDEPDGLWGILFKGLAGAVIEVTPGVLGGMGGMGQALVPFKK